MSFLVSLWRFANKRTKAW